MTLCNARNNIIRLLKANEDMQTFITLTFRDELDYIESKKCLKKLFRKLNYRFNNLKYLWVLEYGGLKGRLHYHLLTNIKLPANINFAPSNKKKSKDHKEYEVNFSKNFWEYGFVDIRSLQQEGNTNTALYVSCYITKDLINKQLQGYRIYGYSNKTLNKPSVYTDYTTDSIEDIISNFKNEYDIIYTNSYEIGYTNNGTDRKGVMSYINMERKKNS